MTPAALHQLTTELAPLLQRYGVAYLGIFGSRARGDYRADSDLDLLVRFKQPVGFFELIQLELELKTLTGHEVDLLTEGGVSPYIKPYILKDLRTIYEE